MEISNPPEILVELSIRKQCAPGSFFSAHALEPGNKTNLTTDLQSNYKLRTSHKAFRRVKKLY